MRGERQDEVRVVFDAKVEAPAARDTRLPDVVRLVVLLRAQRRVPKVPEEELEASIERASDFGGRLGVRCTVDEIGQ